MAITKWPHYADHTVAPLCRSRNGTITPIIDKLGEKGENDQFPSIESKICKPGLGILPAGFKSPSGSRICPNCY